MRITDKRKIIEAMRARGNALRLREAYSRSAWMGYPKAIAKARTGKPENLIDLFTARLPLQGDEYDLMAQFLAKALRKPGRQVREGTHQAALFIKRLKDSGVGPTDAGLSKICKLYSREYGVRVPSESVRDLLRNPRRLQHK
jgi:hypothetical protein